MSNMLALDLAHNYLTIIGHEVYVVNDDCLCGIKCAL